MSSPSVLAVLEQRDGALRKVSHEVVTGARRLADALGGSVDAVLLAASGVKGADQLGRFGADKMITLTNAAFGMYAPEGYARVIAERAATGGYGAVVFAASATKAIPARNNRHMNGSPSLGIITAHRARVRTPAAAPASLRSHD